VTISRRQLLGATYDANISPAGCAPDETKSADRAALKHLARDLGWRLPR
jgi:phospholipase C